MRLRLRIALLALGIAGLLVPGSSLAVGKIHDHQEATKGDKDFRAGGAINPTAAQKSAVNAMGASAWWSKFGTPSSLINHNGYLAQGVAGATAPDGALNWLDANKALFKLASVSTLQLVNEGEFADGAGYAVHFRQVFGGLVAGEDGYVTVGVSGSPGNWNVAYVSSALAPSGGLASAPSLTPQQAWVTAAMDLGQPVSLASIVGTKSDGTWQVLHVSGLEEPQYVRGPVAIPTVKNGVRPAYETLVLDTVLHQPMGWSHYIDAATGQILIRHNRMHHSHPPGAVLQGAVPLVDGACSTQGPWVIVAGEDVRTVAGLVEAHLTINDTVLNLKRNGLTVATGDTLFSPEPLNYSPAGGVPAGTYTLDVCDFADGIPWDAPNTYTGTIAFGPVSTNPTPSPVWRVFPANPQLATVIGYPWNLPSTDSRENWCWVPGGTCDDVVENDASRVPWDMHGRTNTPTFQTVGNNAIATEAWTDPLAPGATFHRPVDLTRNYNFPWTNAWFTSGCSPTQTTVPGVTGDISAATLNLFAMHNRMHDWAYHLGFTERNWNAQAYNYELGGMENDPVLGQSQAGALGGQTATPAVNTPIGTIGGPLGRDNANMRTLPDGVSSITNMYLFQPLKGSFYAPCADGDYDMAIIGHEYGHMIENRMIGKGNIRSGHHAGAMGESNGDLNGVEILNEYGFVPLGTESPYIAGAYATGNFNRGIRNYDMSQSPLNFSNMGYDITGPQVHADGEIWSAVNFQIRQALVRKYSSTHPATNAAQQRECADGDRPASTCPGNRRWAQLMYDAYLLMPTDPSMLVARDAYLAADRMRFGGANQAEIWNTFASRGFGEKATSTNGALDTDTDPRPDWSSPHANEATATFETVDGDTNAPITNARIYIGHFEARTSPAADTNPATNAPGTQFTNNLDDVVAVVAGTYDFVVTAPGYGHTKFTRKFLAGQTVNVRIALPKNWASATNGTTASGDGTSHGSLIDDTEATQWLSSGQDVEGRKVTLNLGGLRKIKVLQASAMLSPGGARLTALRQFEVWACIQTATQDCSTDAGYSLKLASPANAFPGVAPRPTAPDLILRRWTTPTAFNATHIRFVVLHNQCTGQDDFQGVQETDPTSPSDCRTGEEPTADPPNALVSRDKDVRAAELQLTTKNPVFTFTVS